MKISWQFYKDGDGVFQPGFLSDPETILSSSAQLLKSSGYHRFVYRLDDKLVKAFTFSNFIEKLKWKRGFSAPQKEWNILKALYKEGISVPEPIAIGFIEENGKIKVWLVSRFIPDCVTYDEMRPDWKADGAKEQVVKLAELISGMHAAFVVHRDLHAGNLLWQQAEKKWYLTDFQHARRGFCTRVQLEEDLTQLQHCLGKKVPVRTRVEFLKAYIWNFAVITETTETHSRRDYHSVWHEVAENLRGYDLAQARSRSRRAFKSNRDFAPIKVWNGGSGFMRKGESRVLVNDVCALLDKREWQNEKYITRFERKGNYCFAIYDHPQGKVAIEFEQTGFSFIEKLLPFKRKDRRIWRTAARLSLLHIPCERPLLIGRSARSLAYVYLVRGVFNFREAFQMAQNDPAKKEQLLIKLAKLAARMHNCGIVHGGFSCENLSVSEDGAVYIRDFKETRFSSNCSWFGRVDDLARLLASSGSALSYCEQRLFLRTYLGNLVEDVDARLLITDVAYKAVILSEENER